MKKFEIGKEYNENMCMADRSYSVLCIKRTEKFVTFKTAYNKTFRKKISNTNLAYETVYTEASVISAR